MYCENFKVSSSTCTVLNCTVLYCTVLHCTVLYCTCICQPRVSLILLMAV